MSGSNLAAITFGSTVLASLWDTALAGGKKIASKTAQKVVETATPAVVNKVATATEPVVTPLATKVVEVVVPAVAPQVVPQVVENIAPEVAAKVAEVVVPAVPQVIENVAPVVAQKVAEVVTPNVPNSTSEQVSQVAGWTLREVGAWVWNAATDATVGSHVAEYLVKPYLGPYAAIGTQVAVSALVFGVASKFAKPHLSECRKQLGKHHWKKAAFAAAKAVLPTAAGMREVAVPLVKFAAHAYTNGSLRADL